MSSYFIDTTLRDGQQSPLMFDTRKYRFSLEDKKTLVNALIKLGVRHIEFFAPVVSDVEAQDFQELKEYIKTLTSDNVHLLAHCRTHETDISQAIEAGFTGLNLYIGISDRAQKHSHGKDRSSLIPHIESVIKKTREQNPNFYLRFSTEDSFRTPLDDIYELYDRISLYVDTLGMPDTVGIATPQMVAERINAFKTRYPTNKIECHFHNDRGYSLVNAVAAVQAGAEFIDTSIWGLAERSGITSVTGLLLNLYYVDKKYTEQYRTEVCYPLNVLMGSILQWHVPYTEPVSLTNRTHTAGVHQKAVLNNRTVYEAHDLSLFGVNKNEMLLGPLSGWNLVYYYLREVENYNITAEDAKEITKEFKAKATEMGKDNRPEEVLHAVVAQHKLDHLEQPPEESRLRLENLS
jgi:homocitrate synthase